MSAIETATATYSFTYDDFGNMTQIKVDGCTLSTNTYAANNGNLTETEYGNDDSVNYTYDHIDRITKIQYNDDGGATAVFTYTYNANGDVATHTDSVNGETHAYLYDARGNITQRIVRGATVKRIDQYRYDEQGRVKDIDYNYVGGIDNYTLSYYTYTYDSAGNVSNIMYGGASAAASSYTYDVFGRLDTEMLKGSKQYFLRTYSYDTNGSSTSNQVEWDSVSLYGGKAYDTYYEYDEVGNIVLIQAEDKDGNIILRYNYHYDDKSQLIREDLYYGSGNSSNRTMVYTYDQAGNILSKKKYAYINPTSSVSGSYTNYSYGYASTWKDRLTSYNGKSLTYDEIGNPLTYGSYTYTWKYGRQLSTIENGTTPLASFQYNDEGIRTVKIGNGVRHEYDVVGGQINREVVYSSDNSYIAKDIRYYYDASGRPIAIRAFTRTSATASFTDTTYYLLTNLQGDVVGIYNASGTKIYEYAYDAWGNIIKSAQVADGGSDAHAVNPFRYRGYYYDTETGLYYLQSRYYNPEWGRFLNADTAILGVGGYAKQYNAYVYCFNSPVNLSDISGHWPEWVEELGSRFVHTINVMARIAVSPLAGISVTAGGGVGIGVKASSTINGVPIEAGVTSSISDSICFEKGRFDVRNETSTNVGINVAEVFDFSHTVGHGHSYFDDTCDCDFMGSTFGEKSKCVANQSNVSQNASLSISFGAYFIIGFEGSISIDFRAWNQELNDIFYDSMSYGK